MIRVLIADNDKELCITMSCYLNTQADMEVVGIAHDGEQALKLINLHLPDVVILDITMPHLDGMAVLERLGPQVQASQPAVIVHTALAREDIMQRFMELGARYFLIKPCDCSIIAQRIRQFGAPSSPSVIQETRESYKRSPMVEEEARVTRLLHEMGVPPHFKGYNYLRDAVLILLRDPQPMGGGLSSHIYPQLAERYGTTPSGVEAAIRNCILACWEGGNREYLATITGHVGAKRKTFPTNSIVITRIADQVRFMQSVS